MKYCSRCKEFKPYSEFSKKASYCKPCQSAYHKKWRTEINREGYNEYMRNYFAQNPGKRMQQSLRSRLCNIMNGRKDQHLEEYLGVSIDFLMKWIEYQLLELRENDPAMTWENFGDYWVIDHVLPVAYFDHENEEAVKFCWSWINLRPSEKIENIIKKDKIDRSLFFEQQKKAHEFLKLYNLFHYSHKEVS